MQLKSGFIYLVKTRWGEAHEGVFVACIVSANVFSSLPWSRTEIPRIIDDVDIDWVEEICEMNNTLTEHRYHEAILDHNK